LGLVWRCFYVVGDLGWGILDSEKAGSVI